MRKTILLAALAVVFASTAWGQVLDRPAATVRLIRTQSITVSQLQRVIAPLEAQYHRTLSSDERKQVLDQMIGQALIEQAGDRDKIVVPDAELNARIQEYEKNLGQAANMGRPFSDQEMQQYVRNNGASWEDFQKQLRSQLLMVDYARAKNPGLLDTVKPVTEADIQDFYDSHKKEEFVDDIMSVRHIFIDTHTLISQTDKDKARKHAEDILKELKAGASFGDLVMKYSDDTVSKYRGGDIGLIMRSDPSRLQIFGKDFMDDLFKLKKGDTSDVLQSNVGFHIVKVVDRIDAHLLTLDEKIPPQFQMTLRDYIKGNLTLQRQNDVLSTALNSIIATLKKQADVKVFDSNLTW
ncbi:MAG TPA: peptidylprolyl isomerase [Spirochaetia bacterium]|nr:peptidylprolyl isomerase [Spirochaetia bacterium]